MTGSPGRRLLDVPSLITVRLVALTLMTARSVTGSRPTMVAGTRAPLLKTRGDLSALPPVGGDHVVVGEDVALGVDHHAGADVAGVARDHLQRDDRGRDTRGDPGDRVWRALVGVVGLGEGVADIGERAAPLPSAHPATPPMAPTSSAATSRTTRALGLTRRPNSSSGTLSSGPVGFAGP